MSTAAAAAVAVSLPPPSIATDSEAIVTACENAELMPSPVGGELQFVELTELASLLYQSSHTAAKHLHRRHAASLPSATPTSNPELHQFALLWNAATKIMSNDAPGGGGGEAAFAALDSCINSGLQPLATYSVEVRGKYRERMVELLGSAYGKVRIDVARVRLGYGEGEVGVMVDMLKARGWTEEGAFLVLPPDGMGEYGAETEEEKVGGEEGVGAVAANLHGDRIRELTDIVGFMEKDRLNL